MPAPSPSSPSPSPSPSKTFLGTLAAFPKAFLNYDLEPLIDLFFARLEFLFRRAERWAPFLRLKRQTYSLDGGALWGASSDGKREYFLPIRFPTLVESFASEASTPREADAFRTFAQRCAERFHYDFFHRLCRLYEAFAPFDPDSDAQFETRFTPEETERRRDDFFVSVVRTLRAANFIELPKSELDRCLRLRRPGSAPVVARYDDFLEHRVFVRGVVKTEPIAYPRWKCGGRIVEVESERLSRVCVVARLKPTPSAPPPTFGDKLNEAFDDEEPTADDERQEIVLKLFKNVLLEDLKLIAPRVELAFPIFDGVKLGGGFLGAIASAILKLTLASALTLIGFLALLTSFLLATIKGAFGFLNRRTKYLQRYSSSLYYQTLASNRAAISLLVSMAEEQEAKELIVGYFAALRFANWGTEKELDRAAETWLAERFDLAVDFESTDAIRKLLEKRLLERREFPDAVRYRAVPLDEAFQRLDEDWRALGAAPNDATSSDSRF